MQPKGYVCTWYGGVIAVLLVSNFLLIRSVLALRADLRVSTFSVHASAFSKALSEPMQESNGRPVVLHEVPRRYLVLFVFTVGDCASCLNELAELNRLSELRTDVQVFGILAFGNSDEARQTQQNFGVGYPVLDDPAGRLLREFGISETPWKLVLDSQEGRVAYQDPPSFTAAQRDAFVARVVQLPR